MNVVLDTNVLLSGFAVRGLCEAVLDTCFTSPDVQVALSEHILKEFKKHYAGKFKMSKADVDRAVRFLRAESQIVKPVKVSVKNFKDADDLPVLGTLLAANAACLVTGDKELLALKKYEGKSILSPREFMEKITKNPVLI